MSFDDFAKMNESSGVNMSRKEFNRIFVLIDRQKNGKIRLEELKSLSQFMMQDVEEKNKEVTLEWHIEGEKNIKGNDIMIR